jgi:hypothetical protein
VSVLPKGINQQQVAPDNYTVKQTDYKAPGYGYDHLVYHMAKDIQELKNEELQNLNYIDKINLMKRQQAK